MNLPGIAPGTPITPEPVKVILITSVEFPAHQVGHHAIWAIISDWNETEAAKLTLTCALAFEKMGKPHVGAAIRAILKLAGY